MRDDIDPLFDYAERLSGPLPDYLLEVERQTFLKTLAPQMMSGRLQGRILALLSKLAQPERILEIGTFTGYGALCLAEGLSPGGKLITIEGNPEMAHWARGHFAASPFVDRIELLEGDAKARVAELEGEFDLVFLDADKRAYSDYFHLLIDRLPAGGLILADNVLWDGRAHRPEPEPDVVALRAYNELIRNDPRVETVVLPVRDGLSVARRR